MSALVRDRLPTSVYIGRAGRGEDGYFGNPHVVGKLCQRCRRVHVNAASTIPCYRAYFEERVRSDDIFRARVLQLRGRLLWCPGRCTPGPCHGDVIVEWLARNP